MFRRLGLAVTLEQKASLCHSDELSWLKEGMDEGEQQELQNSLWPILGGKAIQV
jgi:hypothetical protein